MRTAFRAGMITNEELWLAALNDRNNVAHAYNEGIAKDIIAHTKKDYYGLFKILQETVETNWLY